jgi:hypothetical protein
MTITTSCSQLVLNPIGFGLINHLGEMNSVCKNEQNSKRFYDRIGVHNGKVIALIACDRTSLNTIKGSKCPWPLLFFNLITCFAKVFGLGDFIEMSCFIISPYPLIANLSNKAILEMLCGFGYNQLC